jgi:hypothetical protein
MTKKSNFKIHIYVYINIVLNIVLLPSSLQLVRHEFWYTKKDKIKFVLLSVLLSSLLRVISIFEIPHFTLFEEQSV